MAMTDPGPPRLKLKEKDDLKVIDRSKRRRKMIVDQNKHQQIIELTTR
jgi:hypothetical protein